MYNALRVDHREGHKNRINGPKELNVEKDSTLRGSQQMVERKQRFMSFGKSSGIAEVFGEANGPSRVDWSVT